MRQQRYVLVLVVLFLVSALTACDRGPTVDVIQSDLQAGLNEMDESLLRITAVRSQGVSPGTSPNTIIAYANVSLELARNHSFGDWAGPTIGTLASILGANVQGIEGVKEKGNTAGDRLFVYASAAYTSEKNGWRYLGGSPPMPRGSVLPEVGTPTTLMGQLQAIVARGQTNESSPGDQLIGRELSHALADIKERLAEQGAIVAGGPVGGEYAKIARALVETARRKGADFTVFHSDGSVANARLVHSGEVALGIVQSDVLALAYAGQGPFASGEPLFEIVALAALYPEPVHVIVPMDSAIKSMRELAGMRVALGGRESGTRLTARRVLAAYSIEIADLGRTDDSDLETAAARLAAGELDAMFATIGAPAGELRRLAARRAIRLLPLDDSVVAELTAMQRSYLPYLIPRGTYRGQSKAVPTVATTAVLVARRTALGSLVENALQAVFFDLDFDAVDSLQGRLISPATARVGLPVPMHRAAERFFASRQ